ncbi:carbohydrate kinase [Chelativorans sp. Marseille-P2723]|uniref:carbohydrate kinase family protein n=1 Tax=Chelativorans sp. Marseille-P2723 TaxID=2709133 RepID=UPI00156FA6E3|nr:carbohydrate kinase [Chelativorans sp. Marseille-P2723]
MILCCGEALIDMLPGKTASGDTAFVPHPGGSVFNSAVALGRLGVPVSLFSGISNDPFGLMLQKTLSRSNVDLSHVVISSRPTTLAFVTLEKGQTSYLFYDEGSPGRMLTEADAPQIGTDVEAMLFGGISLAAEPCGSTYETLMAREHSSRIIMLDPNIRPALVRDVEAHRCRIGRMSAMSDIVKVSQEDLDWLTDATPADAAQQMLDAGSLLVVVTYGAEGATAWWRGGSVRVEARRVKVIDTVGAGDAFNAGLLAALRQAGLLSKERLVGLRKSEAAAALSFAARVAAATVSRAGANPPWREELEG